MAKIWGYEYRTQRDRRVRPGHRDLDGMRYPVGHPVWDMYMPPWDYNCRCFVVPILEGSPLAKIKHPFDFPTVPVEFWPDAEARLSRLRVSTRSGAHMKSARNLNVVLCSPIKMGFKETSPGVFRKELIYPGTFVKKGPDGEIEFRLVVDDKLIDHWVDTFRRMKENGVEVPLPIEHSEEPEDRRGTVVDLKKEFNEARGVDSLYMYATFRSGSEKLAETAQVSLYAPPDMEDGIGNKYVRPITHVAITDYPLVPGLSAWSAVAAASRRGSRRRTLILSKEGAELNVNDVADALGIEYEEDAKPEDILELIEDTYKALVEEVESLDGELPEGVEGTGDESPESRDGEDPLDIEMPEGEDLEDVTISSEELEEIDAAGSGELPSSSTEEEEERPMASARSSRRQVSSSVIRQLSAARRSIIKGLVAERKITPAVASRLERIYVNPKRVAIAASRQSGDDFEGVIAALSNNAPMFRTGSKTGAQHDRSAADKTPLVRDAEARASRLQRK